MTNEPSPRPWRAEPMFNGVADARGEKVAANIRPADAALIVEAVNRIEETKALSIKLYDPIRRAENERDRLRDVVRRLADNLSRYHLVGERERALLREARAALGGAPSP